MLDCKAAPFVPKLCDFYILIRLQIIITIILIIKL